LTYKYSQVDLYTEFQSTDIQIHIHFHTWAMGEGVYTPNCYLQLKYHREKITLPRRLDSQHTSEFYRLEVTGRCLSDVAGVSVCLWRLVLTPKNPRPHPPPIVTRQPAGREPRSQSEATARAQRPKYGGRRSSAENNLPTSTSPGG